MVTPEPASALSVALNVAVVMAAVGFVAGVLYAGIGFFVDLYGPGLNWGTAVAFLALIGMPIIFGAFGFAVGLIGALLYNVFR